MKKKIKSKTKVSTLLATINTGAKKSSVKITKNKVNAQAKNSEVRKAKVKSKIKSTTGKQVSLGNQHGRMNPFEEDEFMTAVKRAVSKNLEVVDEYRLRKADKKERHVTLSASQPPACAATMFVDGLVRQADLKRLKRGELPLAAVAHDQAVKGAIGTARHALLQQFLGRNGSVISDWACKCGKKESASFYRPCKAGPACGLEPQEIGLAYHYKGKKRIGGKIDVLWMDRNKDLWIVDLKFVNRYKLEWVRKHIDGGYERQQRRYLAALKRRFKRLVGYKLMYQNSIEESIDHKNTFVRSVRLDDRDWGKLNREFHSELDKVAVGADTAVEVIDGRKLLPSHIKEIKKHKACADRSWYEQNVQSVYYQCPLADQCLVGKLGTALKARYKELKKEL